MAESRVTQVVQLVCASTAQTVNGTRVTQVVQLVCVSTAQKVVPQMSLVWGRAP